MNKTKSYSFENINKTNKLLAELTLKREEKIVKLVVNMVTSQQISKIRKILRTERHKNRDSEQSSTRSLKKYN